MYSVLCHALHISPHTLELHTYMLEVEVELGCELCFFRHLKGENVIVYVYMHHPTSQGWTFRCPVIVCLFICLTCMCVSLVCG